jgi:hypothetical protein
MHFDRNGQLKFRRSSDFITTPFFGDNDITHELEQILRINGISEDNVLTGPSDLAAITRYQPTASETTIYVWAHGNRHRNAIGGGNARKSPDELLDFLKEVGVQTTFAGDICIWSCWSGVLDGFCHAFALRCRARGFLSLSVWGSRFVTGTMVNLRPLILGSELLRALAVEGVRPADLEVKGEPRPTTRNDLNVFRPANAMAIRAAEI